MWVPIKTGQETISASMFTEIQPVVKTVFVSPIYPPENNFILACTAPIPTPYVDGNLFSFEEPAHVLWIRLSLPLLPNLGHSTVKSEVITDSLLQVHGPSGGVTRAAMHSCEILCAEQGAWLGDERRLTAHGSLTSHLGGSCPSEKRGTLCSHWAVSTFKQHLFSKLSVQRDTFPLPPQRPGIGQLCGKACKRWHLCS